MEPCIGVNLPGGTAMAGLDAALARICADGFAACEINLASCPLIIGGKLQMPIVRFMKSVLDRHALRYTAHIGYGLDLRCLEERALQRAVMLASIDACAALGIDTLNFHFEERSRHSDREQMFFDCMAEACDYSATRGVQINLENIEVEDARLAVAAVRRLAHPNLGMTLDLGHLFISARYFGYDFAETVRDCAPLVRHLHVNDNTGDFEPLRLENQLLYNTMEKGYRFAFGRGDIHIPPLWGSVPLRDSFAMLKAAGYKGVWLLEYYSHLFHPLNADILKNVRAAIETA